MVMKEPKLKPENILAIWLWESIAKQDFERARRLQRLLDVITAPIVVQARAS